MSSALIVTGDVVTLDPEHPRVQAVAIEDGVVAATGTPSEVASAVPAGTPARALQGTVVPGLIDSHVHMLWCGRERDRVSLTGVASIAEIVRRIADFAAANPGAGWLEGSADIDARDLAERRFPTHAELEEATGGRPLLLDRRSHDGLVNTSALRVTGIGATTPDPPGRGHRARRAGRADGLPHRAPRGGARRAGDAGRGGGRPPALAARDPARVPRRRDHERRRPSPDAG